MRTYRNSGHKNVHKCRSYILLRTNVYTFYLCASVLIPDPDPKSILMLILIRIQVLPQILRRCHN